VVRSGVQEPDSEPQATLTLRSEKFIGTIFLKIQFLPVRLHLQYKGQPVNVVPEKLSINVI
jgi:hypothetical protein